jgi:hypothetical protein
MTLEVRPLTTDDQPWVRDVLARAWGSPFIVTLNGLRDASVLPGFVAASKGERRGWNLIALHRDVLAEWRKLKPAMSMVGLDAIPMRHALELEYRLLGGCPRH